MLSSKFVKLNPESSILASKALSKPNIMANQSNINTTHNHFLNLELGSANHLNL
jgi:hypothetical protein